MKALQLIQAQSCCGLDDGRLVYTRLIKRDWFQTYVENSIIRAVVYGPQGKINFFFLDLPRNSFILVSQLYRNSVISGSTLRQTACTLA